MACSVIAGKTTTALHLSLSLPQFPSKTLPKPILHQHQRHSRFRICTMKKSSDTPVPAAASTGADGRVPSLKTRLKSGERLYGMFMLGFSPLVAEIAGYAGYDYAVVDMEHGAGGIESAVPMLRALAATGTPAILRIPDNDPVAAKRALDLGPQGIMIPMVSSAKAAKRAVSYCRYPPRGVRGAAFPAVRASRYGLDTEYLQTLDDELLIVCQVESEEAVDKIDEIAEVPGVDCIQMGPTDLAADLGCLHDLGHKKAKETLLRAEKAVLKQGKAFLCGFAMPDDPPLDLQSRGYHMVAGAVDTVLIREAALADLRKHKFCSTSDRVDDTSDTKDVAATLLEPQNA